MEKKNKVILLVLAMIVVLGAAGILYGQLKDRYDTGSNLSAATPSETQQNVSSVPQETVAASQEAAADEQANKAPDIEFQNQDGELVTLSSLEGKPVILNFWASWCPPCRSEMPEFQKAYDTYGDQITFAIVNMTDGGRETLEKAQSFIEEQGYTFPVYYDVNQNAAYTYQVYSLPTTYFLDSEGNVVANAKGALDAATLEKGIGMILE